MEINDCGIIACSLEEKGWVDSDLGLLEAALPQPMIPTVSGGGIGFALASVSQFGFPLWAYALEALSQLPVNFG